jgi:putative transposase
MHPLNWLMCGPFPGAWIAGYSSAKKEHVKRASVANRAENSHQPTRRRELIMKRFKSARQPQRFLSVHDQVANLFHIPYPKSAPADFRRASRRRAFAAWREISQTGATA